MKYPAQYLHSDDIVLDNAPKYKGVIVPPRRDNLFERDAMLSAPAPVYVRPGAQAALVIPSKGTSC